MRALLLTAVATAVLTGCGNHASSAGGPPSGSTTAAATTSTAPTSTATTSTATTATVDRTACAAQLRTGAHVTDRKRLTRLSLERFQLRSNDLQEVVEEANHVCPASVVRPLTASMLRLLNADDYLLSCAPSRTCDPSRLRRILGDVQSLEEQAAARFRG